MEVHHHCTSEVNNLLLHLFVCICIVCIFVVVCSDQLFVNKQEQMVVCTARAEKNDYYIGKQGLHYILAQRG